MSDFIGEDIKAVLFDHDDTLVGTIEAKWAQHKHIAKKWYNKELLDEEIRQHWGKPWRTLVKHLYDTNDVDEAIERTLLVHKNFPKKLFESTIGVLEHIREQGKFVGVITATGRFSFQHDMELLGIPLALFDYTQTEDDTPVHKPDPKVFDPAKTWLAQHNIQPHEAVYIADSLNDLKAAQGAGFQFIGVTTGLTSAKEFEKAGAKSIASLADLLSKTK